MPKKKKSYFKGLESAMQVTGGEFNGDLILVPKNAKTHPMGSRERLGLFNTLYSLMGRSMEGETVLDAFCGSGALGIEALSRGAGKVIFIESDYEVCETTYKNVTRLGLQEYTMVNNGDATAARDFLYDIIFADPPYDDFPDDLDNLADMLRFQGYFVLSHPDNIDPETYFKRNMELLTTKTYAGCNLAFYRQRKRTSGIDAGLMVNPLEIFDR